MIKQFREYSSKIDWSTFILILSFSCSSWICATSIWAQLPLIIFETTESWRLPSILTLLAQLAQLGPMVFFPLLKRCLNAKLLSNKRIIYAKLTVELAALLSLIFYWNKTFYFLGENRTLFLYTINFVFNLFDGMSTVSFLPFISESLAQEYVIPVYIGEGFASLVPSSIVFIQGINRNEQLCQNTSYVISNITFYELKSTKPESNFSVSVFFGAITLFFLSSFVSFLFLSKKIAPKPDKDNKNDEKMIFLDNSKDKATENLKKNYTEIIYLLMISFSISFFMYGVLLGLQSYSTLAYSHLAFNLSINFGNLMLPLVIFFSIVSFKLSVRAITIEFLVALSISIYIVYISFCSPCPPLNKHWSGSALIVIAWIVCECLFLRLRCVIAANLEKYGQKILIILGWITLLGQVCGGIIIYILVDILKVFVARADCQDDSKLCRK